MTKKDFERLHPGRIIRNKKDSNQAFIVGGIFQEPGGVRVTAVRTIEIRDGRDWEIVETVIDNTAE